MLLVRERVLYQSLTMVFGCFVFRWPGVVRPKAAKIECFLVRRECVVEYMRVAYFFIVTAAVSRRRVPQVDYTKGSPFIIAEI